MAHSLSEPVLMRRTDYVEGECRRVDWRVVAVQTVRVVCSQASVGVCSLKSIMQAIKVALSVERRMLSRGEIPSDSLALLA